MEKRKPAIFQNGGRISVETKKRCFSCEEKRRTCPECYRQSSSHAFILFAAICGADSSSSDLHFGSRISVSAPVSCLLAVQSAMTGFRPDSFRCFGTVSCAQLRSSGFPFLLRRCLQKHAPATVHRMAYSEIFTAKSTSCGFHGYYTRYIRSLQAIPRLYARFFTFRRRRKIPVRSLLYSDAPG